MDPSYQQMMIQQLMQQGQQSNPMQMGQNASTPYGQSFMTGGQMMPQQPQGMIGAPVPPGQMLAQNQATYSGQ